MSLVLLSTSYMFKKVKAYTPKKEYTLTQCVRDIENRTKEETDFEMAMCVKEDALQQELSKKDKKESTVHFPIERIVRTDDLFLPIGSPVGNTVTPQKQEGT